jgi:hypothetical protein
VIDLDGGLSVFVDNPGEALQELALFSPTWDPTIGFSALVPVDTGVYVLEARQDLHSPWLARTTFGSSTPGIRRVTDSISATRSMGLYRVTKNP